MKLHKHQMVGLAAVDSKGRERRHGGLSYGKPKEIMPEWQRFLRDTHPDMVTARIIGFKGLEEFVLLEEPLHA